MLGFLTATMGPRELTFRELNLGDRLVLGNEDGVVWSLIVVDPSEGKMLIDQGFDKPYLVARVRPRRDSHTPGRSKKRFVKGEWVDISGEDGWGVGFTLTCASVNSRSWFS